MILKISVMCDCGETVEIRPRNLPEFIHDARILCEGCYKEYIFKRDKCLNGQTVFSVSFQNEG